MRTALIAPISERHHAAASDVQMALAGETARQDETVLQTALRLHF